MGFDLRASREAGDIELPPPTFVTLVWASSFDSVSRAVENARARVASILRYVPRVVLRNDGAISLYEGDAGYDTRDPDVHGPRHRLSMLKSGWRYER